MTNRGGFISMIGTTINHKLGTTLSRSMGIESFNIYRRVIIESHRVIDAQILTNVYIELR